MGQRFFPLDEALGLLPGAYTPQVQGTITRLGSRLTYREAQEELKLMWQVDISKSGLRHITMRHGRVADTCIEEKVAHLEAGAETPAARPQQIVMCADGAMVQLTTGEWREVKTVALGEFGSYWDAKHRKIVTRTEQVSYFSRVASAEAFARSALVEWQRRGGENADRVVAVNDGAAWIQSFVDYHCPQAIRVIDFAHAQAYVAVVGRTIYGAETDAFQRWYGQMSKQLGRRPPQRTIAELRLLHHQHRDHPEAELVDSAIRYLEKRLPMIDYPRFRAQQIPIGSGIGESAHKVVMQRRMKQAGMRWAEANLNPMLALRTALTNQTWSSSWQEIVARIHHDKYPFPAQQDHSLYKETPATTISEADCQRLTALANKLAKTAVMRKPWQDHRWIFPHRQNLIHRN